MFLNDYGLEKAKSLKEGDMVSWNSSGGRATGKVIHVMDYGTLDIPNTKFKIKGEKDNPAVLIQLYRDGKETDIQVGHKMSSLTKSLDEQLLKHGSHNQKTHAGSRGRGSGGAGSANETAKPNDSEKYYDAGYDDALMEDIDEQLFGADEEFEEVLTDLEDELGISRGLDGAARQNRNVRAPDQIKEQIKYVTTAQDSLGRARTSVDEASRPVDTDALFDTHIGDVTRAQNHLEDAINELGNGDNSVQGLQSTLRDALGELRDYGDQLDERALKKNLVSKHASHNQSSHGKGGGAETSGTKSFTPAKISAKDIKVGDRLDKAGKTRVHAVKMIGDKIAVGIRTRGSRGGGFKSWNPEEDITVFRKVVETGLLKHGSHNQKTHAGSRGRGAGGSGSGSSATRPTPTTMPFRPTGKDKLDEALFTRLDRKESNAAYVNGWKQGQAQSKDDKLFNAANSWIDMTDKAINEGKMPNDGFLLETARAVGLVNGMLQAK